MELWRKLLTEAVSNEKLRDLISNSKEFFFEVEGAGVCLHVHGKNTSKSIASGLKKVYEAISSDGGANEHTQFQYRASVIIAIPKESTEVVGFMGKKYANQCSVPEGKIFFIFKLPDDVLKNGYGIEITF